MSQRFKHGNHAIKYDHRSDKYDEKNIDPTGKGFGDREQGADFQPSPIEKAAHNQHYNELQDNFRHGVTPPRVNSNAAG
jgi:hypothetical protein